MTGHCSLKGFTSTGREGALWCSFSPLLRKTEEERQRNGDDKTVQNQNSDGKMCFCGSKLPEAFPDFNGIISQ